MHGLPPGALDELARLLARVCDDPWDTVISVPARPGSTRRDVAQLTLLVPSFGQNLTPLRAHRGFMNPAERAVRFRAAIEGRGTAEEVALARTCAGLPSHWEERAEAVWEGALTAQVSSAKLGAAVEADCRYPLAALADIAEVGDDPSSRVVRYQRAWWAAWQPPGPQ